jgi:ankyrin repeat protein
MDNEIFDLIKLHKFKELLKMIKNNKKINLEIKDNSNNYLIHYILMFNQIEIFKILLERNIRLDILDVDGKTILYIPIKFNYIEIIKLLLLYQKKSIGISLLDVKDTEGNTPLHYTIILKNINIVKLLINNNADPLLKNKKGLNSIQISIKHNNKEITKYLLNIINNINNIYTNSNLSLLQYAIINNNEEDTIDLLLDNIINIDNQENENGFGAIHQSIINNNINLTNKLIKYGANINLQDYYGNTLLMYVISEKSINIINLLIENKINYNLTNIDGNTALHMLLQNIDFYKNNENILINLFKNTDLLIQNNDGNTSLYYIIENNIFIKYKEIFINKELNIFIKNTYDLIENNKNKDEIFKIVIESYYNYLKKNKNKLIIDWEILCSNDKIDKLKCFDKIKNIIINEKRSMPKLNNINYNIENGIVLDICYYTGSSIDILFGILFLYNKFKNIKLEIIIDYPLITNNELIKYYNLLGINANLKSNFSNFEIIWSYQKLFFPTFFDEEIKKKIKTSNYIVIPVGIEISIGAHANILFWDIKNKTIERFEPNGAYQPKDFNYNYNLLDLQLQNKFKSFDANIKYIQPNDYLPIIGFQILENVNDDKCKRIGDPNGFCGVWCIWWIYKKLEFININSSTLANNLIKEIKYNNLSFKNIIRNFSGNITNLRDLYLKKYKLDINKLISDDFDKNIINKIENDILNNFK